MAANKEYICLLECIKKDLLPPDISNKSDNVLEKELLTELAEEAAFVGFFSEIGLCTSNSLVAINSRLQKQSKTTISLQLGSHIGAEFEALQSNVLIDNHYKILLPQNELDRKMQPNRKHISYSKGRTVKPLWNYMVELEKRKRKLHIFSVTAHPLKYEKDPRTNHEEEEEEEEEEEGEEERGDDEDNGGGRGEGGREGERGEEKERDDEVATTIITTADGDGNEDGKNDGVRKYKDATTNWPLCDNCRCVARISRKLDDVDDEGE
uniref:Wsv133-like protein n=1 Tax=Penaeus monodon majanivirus B TaxID=2984272 RepID=A0A9C7EY71_9VIRU|nr:MAG: wsv133-like protein [Penaeus monodon majanivirus B]